MGLLRGSATQYFGHGVCARSGSERSDDVGAVWQQFCRFGRVCQGGGQLGFHEGGVAEGELAVEGDFWNGIAVVLQVNVVVIVDAGDSLLVDCYIFLFLDYPMK